MENYQQRACKITDNKSMEKYWQQKAWKITDNKSMENYRQQKHGKLLSMQRVKKNVIKDYCMLHFLQMDKYRWSIHIITTVPIVFDVP